MPLLFIGTGVVFLLTGLQGDAGTLYNLIKGDFTGKNNYVYWMLSILILGSLGYIKSLESLSKVFVALVIVVLLLDNKGFFTQLQAFVKSSDTATANSNSNTTTPNSTPSGSPL